MEYRELQTKKRALYPEYRKARAEMQELLRAQRNIELFFADEMLTRRDEQSR